MHVEEHGAIAFAQRRAVDAAQAAADRFERAGRHVSGDDRIRHAGQDDRARGGHRCRTLRIARSAAAPRPSADRDAGIREPRSAACGPGMTAARMRSLTAYGNLERTAADLIRVVDSMDHQLTIRARRRMSYRALVRLLRAMLADRCVRHAGVEPDARRTKAAASVRHGELRMASSPSRCTSNASRSRISSAARSRRRSSRPTITRRATDRS